MLTKTSENNKGLEMIINTFDDFCLFVYVIVDDFLKKNPSLSVRPGPLPVTSDSEIITMILTGECRGWDIETELLVNFKERPQLFPIVPSQSRFNRRRRNLMWVVNHFRRGIMSQLDLAQDNQCLIDSLPIPVVNFHLVPSSTGDWAAFGARFGKISSKKQTFYGFRLHLLVTLNGLILDFILAPANATDLEVGHEILNNHFDLSVLGDKAYINADKAKDLYQRRRVRLLSLPRRNQKKQVPKVMRRLFNSVRQLIETVNGQLAEQFSIEKNHAHTFDGLIARLYSKLAAHTMCIYINRLMNKENFLQIKNLAFSN